MLIFDSESELLQLMKFNHPHLFSNVLKTIYRAVKGFWCFRVRGGGLGDSMGGLGDSMLILKISPPLK